MGYLRQSLTVALRRVLPARRRWFAGTTVGRYVVRGYREGDEAPLNDLRARAYSDYSGPVRKTADQWRWCILERPGILPDDVVVVDGDSGVAGYGVLGPRGRVLELALEPDLDGNERRKLAGELLTALENRSRERGDESLTIHVPEIDQTLLHALRGHDYRPIGQSESLQWVIVDLAGLIRRVLSHRRGDASVGQCKDTLLRLQPGNYHFCPHDRIGIHFNSEIEVVVAPERSDYDVTIDLDMSTFTDLFFGMSKFESSVADGGLRVDPPSAVECAKSLFALLILRKPWYTVTADTR